tara:strand:+ start:3018 stop:3245 length:228 start_codon:yes stop_codon:yes gene_type:complete
MTLEDVRYSSGTVQKIHVKGGRVAVKYGRLCNLDMLRMPMVFCANNDMFAKMASGQDIGFVEDRVKGKNSIVKLK